MPITIEPKTLVQTVIDELPAAREVFLRLGYRCVASKGDDCVVAEKDTLAVAAELHKMDPHVLLTELRALQEKGGNSK